MYHEALREQELEMDQLSQELESTRGFLRGTQTSLQESESRIDESLKEIHQRSTSSALDIIVDMSIPEHTMMSDSA
jgi:predicted  nucleic acid-binding Zn-ribbon protein